MSFKCFFSFFCGALSILLGQRFYTFYGKPFLIALILTAGFVISQIVCYVIHIVMKEKHDFDNRTSSRDFWS